MKDTLDILRHMHIYLTITDKRNKIRNKTNKKPKIPRVMYTT